MDFKEVIWIVAIYNCFACVVSNESVQLIPRCKAAVSKTNLINSGEATEANGYKVLHDFNFPDVTYPTSALESCQPFYFNSNGFDAIVGPFSSDVQSNYRSLLNNENKIKDVTTKKSIVDDIQYDTSLSNRIIDNNRNESHNDDVLEVVRNLFEKYMTKNHVDSELKEILSVLFGGNVKESNSSEINKIVSAFEEPVALLDEIIRSNLTINKSSEENMSESVEELIDRLSAPTVMNSVIEELIQLLDKSLDQNLMSNNSNEDYIETVNDIPRSANSSNSDNDFTIQTLSNETTNSNVTSDIQLALELTKEDVKYILLNSTTTDLSHSHRKIDDLQDANSTSTLRQYPSISSNTEFESVKGIDDIFLISELIITPEIIFSNQNCNDSILNENLNTTQQDSAYNSSDQFNINQSVEVYEVVNDPINLINSTTNEEIMLNSNNTDEISFIIPKEPVVFDVVYRDAYNLEKPVLDIVPSSIPVRLKINIEIVKQDSSEIDDFFKTEINNEQFSPRTYENNMDLEDVSNSIQNIEEDTATEEQITVLDEINESDFINALSILLLDSLNNNPIEIIPPEFNNSCNLIIGDSTESSHNFSMISNNLTNYIHSENIQPFSVPEVFLPIDTNKEQGALEMDSHIVKYNTSPLIEMLRSVVTADLDNDDKNNITEILKIENLVPGNNNGTCDELNNIFSLNSTNTTAATQDVVSNKACSSQNIEENKLNTLLINTTDTNTMWPLDIIQLKICPTEHCS